MSNSPFWFGFFLLVGTVPTILPLTQKNNTPPSCVRDSPLLNSIRESGSILQEKNKGLVRWMTPEQVVEYSLSALAKDQVVCIPGLWNKVLVALPKIIPFALYQKFAPGMGGTKAR